MPYEERIVIIMWDEVALQGHTDYKISQDRVYGFEEWGNDYLTQNLADHSNTFTVRGLQSNWVLSLAYGFCHATTPAHQTVQEINDIIYILKPTAGLVVAGRHWHRVVGLSSTCKFHNLTFSYDLLI